MQDTVSIAVDIYQFTASCTCHKNMAVCVHAHTDDNPYDFSVMTINMDGPGSAKKKQKAVNLALKVSNQEDSPFKPAIIFAQQIGAPKTKNWKLDLDAYQYEYDRGSTKEAGVLWLKESFERVKPYIDAGFKAKVTDTFKNDASFRSDIPARLTAVVLEHVTKTFKLLAVSWHGPKNRLKQTVKLTVFHYLQLYVQKIKDFIGDLSLKCVLIGGDFNLDFRKKDLVGHLQDRFFYENYTMSQRRKKKELIDNFLFIRNSLTVRQIEALQLEAPPKCKSSKSSEGSGNKAGHSALMCWGSQEKEQREEGDRWILSENKWTLQSTKKQVLTALDHDPVLALLTVH